MKVFILAAGQGTRLAPLTNDRPKCLVELGGITLLERQFRVFSSNGLNDLTVIAGYKAEKIRALGFNIALNSRFASTNMVATLFSARELMNGSEDIIVSYGDIVFEPRVLQALLECSAPVCVAVDTAWKRYWTERMGDPLTDAETLKLTADGRITELGKKPNSLDEIQGQYIGLIKFKAEIIPALLELYDAIDRTDTFDGKDFDNMFMTSFIQYLIDNEWDVRAVKINNGWLEFDTLRDLEKYEKWLIEGRSFYRAS